MGDERADIEAHADGDQKHPDEQPFERVDGSYRRILVMS